PSREPPLRRRRGRAVSAFDPRRRLGGSQNRRRFFTPMSTACRASPLVDPWAQNDPLVDAGFESAPSSKWNQGDSLEGVPFRRKAARKPLMEESPAHRR